MSSFLCNTHFTFFFEWVLKHDGTCCHHRKVNLDMTCLYTAGLISLSNKFILINEQHTVINLLYIIQCNGGYHLHDSYFPVLSCFQENNERYKHHLKTSLSMSYQYRNMNELLFLLHIQLWFVTLIKYCTESRTLIGQGFILSIIFNSGLWNAS